MTDPLIEELQALNQRLLDAIAAGDWAIYEELSDPGLTAVEPEAHGQLVEGLPFHRYYFQLGGVKGPHRTTMCQLHVRPLGADAAVLTYARLIQRLGPDGAPVTVASQETRVWQRQGGRWRQVHFHRTALS